MIKIKSSPAKKTKYSAIKRKKDLIIFTLSVSRYISNPGYLDYIFIVFRRREFPTTEIELAAIAKAARAGLRSSPKNGYKIPIATGIRITL